MSRLVRGVLVGLMTAALLAVVATNAMAQQRQGTAKARGEFGKGFQAQSQRASGGTYVPMRTDAESYRSFSYEPIGINVGDKVAVKSDGVQLKLGDQVLGILPKGLEFKVIKVTNGWLGAKVEVNGEKLNGWIWHNNVTSADQAASAAPQAARDDAGAQTYRRFSYEPAQQVQRRSGATSRDTFPADVRLRPGSGR